MKRITLCALLMTLFLLSSCNNSGKDLTDDEVAKSDGTVIDLAKITNNIKDSVAFAKDVKEVHSLVKSIDELAKAIGKKIDDNGIVADAANKDNNGFLLSGVYQVIDVVTIKLGALEKITSTDESIKRQVADSKSKGISFLGKLKSKKTELGKKDASEDDAKKAVDRNNVDKSLGAQELIELNTTIDALLAAAEAAVTSAINELTTPVKPSN
ncbi:Vsp/OspC family lipoprotein (plasmid) [Borrelia puertoricensis]|uniref:Vsp/OspC family lipoprotein n=1 Tax=Borrelia puertoricensis TaxID=2756107 RepID=UPI003EBF28EC